MAERSHAHGIRVDYAHEVNETMRRINMVSDLTMRMKSNETMRRITMRKAYVAVLEVHGTIKITREPAYCQTQT